MKEGRSPGLGLRAKVFTQMDIREGLWPSKQKVHRSQGGMSCDVLGNCKERGRWLVKRIKQGAMGVWGCLVLEGDS